MEFTLEGGGHVELSDGNGNIIVGTTPDATLTNVDNTISGAGQLGEGQLTLHNQGTIIASGSNALTIDTGANEVVNSGTLRATGSGGLVIHSDIANSGLLWANGGNVTTDGNVSGTGSVLIDGVATFEMAGAFSGNVTLDVGANATLKIDHAGDFRGTVAGFDSNDVLDLPDLAFGSSTTLRYAANGNNTGGTLTASDGTHTANIALLGQYTAASFVMSADDFGGILIHDVAPATLTPTLAQPQPSTSLFTASNTPTLTGQNDGRALEVGMKFTSSVAGQITALKFYRSPSDTGPNVVDLWTSTGTKLASATFTNTAASGWQTVTLATPVAVTAGTTCIASYHTTGAYGATDNFFTDPVTSGPLTAPSNAAAGGNGVYAYGGTTTTGIFADQTFASANYYADVVFQPQLVS